MKPKLRFDFYHTLARHLAACIWKKKKHIPSIVIRLIVIPPLSRNRLLICVLTIWSEVGARQGLRLCTALYIINKSSVIYSRLSYFSCCTLQPLNSQYTLQKYKFIIIVEWRLSLSICTCISVLLRIARANLFIINRR